VADCPFLPAHQRPGPAVQEAVRGGSAGRTRLDRKAGNDRPRKAVTPMTIQELRDGRWRPAVPLPHYAVLHVTCHCGRRFWGWRIQVQRGAASERYQRHYRKEHIGE
jgi:hypothetical protein